MTRPLEVTRIEVTPAHLRVDVLVSSREQRRTALVAEERIRELEDILPGLVRHRCDCGSARGMSAELRDTETAHLLEHIALELMALSGSPRTLAGRTEWDFREDGEGVFHVRLDYDDDAVAIGAVRFGADFVAWLFGAGPQPDPESMVRRLHEVRTVPADPGPGH